MLDVPLPLSEMRVLVVEDEPLVAIMLEDFVQDLGCRFVQTVGTTSGALEALETATPDLVILDVTLNGAEPDFGLADALAAKGIPFLFSSGHHPDIVPERHRDRPFLGKPFATSDLVEAIARCR